MKATTLGALCTGGDALLQTGPFGSQLHAHEYSADGVAVVMPRDIRAGQLDLREAAHIPPVTASRLRRHSLRAGDIVYSRRGDVEKCALVHERNLPAICGTGSLLVRVNRDEAVPGYVAHRLNHEDTRKWIRQHAVGATMPNLNTQILANVPLQVPPLPEQQAIAEVLGALDDKIAANATLIERALTLAETHFQFSRERATQLSTFDEVGLIGGGATPSTKVSEYWGGEVNWAAPSDITALNAPYLWRTPRTLTKAGLNACSSPLYPVGSILMTSRATIGAFAVAMVPTAVNQGFIVVQPRDAELKWWLFHEMRRRVPEFLNQANGATFLELPRGKFRSLPLTLPDGRDLSRFHVLATSLHDRASAADRESQTLAALRDTLLSPLMDGTLRVKDAIRHAEDVL